MIYRMDTDGHLYQISFLNGRQTQYAGIAQHVLLKSAFTIVLSAGLAD